MTEKVHKESKRLSANVISCRLCGRLVRWREKTAKLKVKRYRDSTYWGRPVPGFGDPGAKLLVIGLAPAAHGGNRTGRIFTGDRSGDWLFRALHKFGFANQPESVSLDDGLFLRGCYVTAAAHCAPPKNKLLPSEILNCRPFLLNEMKMLREAKVVIALGKVSFDAALKAYRDLGFVETSGRRTFGHGREYKLNQHVTLVSSYHPSQQNTFTGRLTEKMFDDIFRRARELVNSK